MADKAKSTKTSASRTGAVGTTPKGNQKTALKARLALKVTKK